MQFTKSQLRTLATCVALVQSTIDHDDASPEAYMMRLFGVSEEDLATLVDTITGEVIEDEPLDPKVYKTGDLSEAVRKIVAEATQKTTSRPHGAQWDRTETKPGIFPGPITWSDIPGFDVARRASSPVRKVLTDFVNG